MNKNGYTAMGIQWIGPTCVGVTSAQLVTLVLWMFVGHIFGKKQWFRRLGWPGYPTVMSTHNSRETMGTNTGTQVNAVVELMFKSTQMC